MSRGNPYHDAKGLFTTPDGSLSPHMAGRLSRSLGEKRQHFEARFTKVKPPEKQLSAGDLDRLRSRFGKIIK